MRNLIIFLLLFISVTACKKDKTNLLTVKVSNIAPGTTYIVIVESKIQNKSILTERDKTANTTYTVPVVSGDDLTCSYLITTPGVTVGIGTVVFSINGNTSYSATNGSGFNNLKVP
jgi:hypothetical protein